MDIPPDRSVVYASCTAPGHDVLETLLDEGVPITEIVSIDPEAARRHEVSGYASFEDVAQEHEIPLYYPTSYSMDDDADLDHFLTLEADLLIVNGWQRLIPGPILETFEYGALGNHGSAFGLPRGRGRSPLNWSLIEDLDRFLLSVIRLDPGADSGDVAATRKFDVTDHDTIETLYYKVTMSLKEMLLEVVPPLLREEFAFTSQDGEPTYYPKRNPEDGALHWGNTTCDLYNLVRAVADPYPGAFTFHDGERVEIWAAIPFSADLAATAPAGTIVDVFWTGDFVVATADGTLLVTEWEADAWEPEPGMTFESRGRPDRVDSPEHRHNLTSSSGSAEANADRTSADGGHPTAVGGDPTGVDRDPTDDDGR